MTGHSWLGVDLGGTSVKWQHIADDGTVLDSGSRPTPHTGHLAVTDAIEAVCAERLAADPHTRGVGVAVPGHLTADREQITLLPNVPGTWVGFPFAERLEEWTGLRPVLLNDARAFAVAELELGAAQGLTDVLFCTIGTGVGGAVAVDGAVVSSRRDTFGEVGHVTAVVDGVRCGCGSRGCVEAYSGGNAVLTRARSCGIAVTDGPDALRALARRALGDQLAARVLEEAYDAFAVGVATACAYTGAGTVVVGGAVAAELPDYLTACRRRLAHRRELLGDVEIRSAALGTRAGALGAALHARTTHHQTGELIHR